MKPWQTWTLGVGGSVLAGLCMWAFMQVFQVHIRLTALEVTVGHQHEQIEKLGEVVLGLIRDEKTKRKGRE